jgi:hypothetical protein
VHPELGSGKAVTATHQDLDGPAQLIWMVFTRAEDLTRGRAHVASKAFDMNRELRTENCLLATDFQLFPHTIQHPVHKMH